MSTLSQSKLQNKKVALIGCGDIGNRLAVLLQKHGAEVTGFRRNPEKVVAVINAEALDVTDAGSVSVLTQQDFDYVVISLTPGISAKVKDQAAVAAAYQKTYVDGLKNILAALNLKSINKLIWLSSTSVYAQDDNSWVDELSNTEPSRTSGQSLLAAEQLLAPLADKGIVLRLAGIYREGSHRLLTQLRNGKLAANVDTDYYTNRIHVQDCARMIEFLLLKDAQASPLKRVYIGCDNSPVLYTELVAYLAQQTGLPLNTEQLAKKPAVGSKRCSNAAITDAGFEFLFPTYQSGFDKLIQA
ncbi:MAG: NAD-dependent epimerase/dehydratase family protein [Pseudomonadales bacterium]|nr:NAD-dependent epimerase/dehydratase family protein [Pseudomonadales bacterium]